MHWSDRVIQTLNETGWVTFRPKGNSMVPLVHSGDEVTLKACSVHDVSEGDIVLCKVKGNHYLHLVNRN